MTPDRYDQIQTTVILAGAMTHNLLGDDPKPFAEFLEAIDSAAAVGPILDPTLYKAGIRRLEKVRAVAKAAVELRTAHAELVAVIAETEHLTKERTQ